MQALSIQDFQYELPDERIARFPVTPRDASKLLLYRKGMLEDRKFFELPEVLPSGAALVFNNTKVIYARLYFMGEDGLEVEVFLLEPTGVSLEQAMQQKGSAQWLCMVGNLKKWRKRGSILKAKTAAGDLEVFATLLAEDGNTTRDRQAVPTVLLQWKPAEMSLGQVLEQVGNIPLPPYLKREVEATDATQYQTVYAKKEGAVAAPTAGLHFTDAVLDAVDAKGHHRVELTLHVSAGTFAPVKVDNVLEHAMHKELMIIPREAVEQLVNTTGPIIPVGTTSMRTLESLYWYGVMLQQGHTNFEISQFFAYQHDDDKLPTRQEALNLVLHYMRAQQLSELVGETAIMIMPGYRLRVCNGIITNFHQPGSTLMLLIAALVGDSWKRIYDHALANDYRFLSYGDSSLLLP